MSDSVATARAALARTQRGRPHAAARALAHLGPALMVAVGYVDPGNWASGLAAGSAFGMELLSVVLAASVAGMLLQALAAKLGVASGMDLAQACRARYGRRTTLALWILCEVAICACDLAELLGAAIALQLLFGLPLMAGAALTSLDVLLLMGLRALRLRRLEIVTAAVLTLVIGAVLAELALARPGAGEIVRGLLPTTSLVRDPQRLYLAVAILGATVMPHNLYLHSALVRSGPGAGGAGERRGALRSAVLASGAALGLAAVANAAIVALSASTFHAAGLTGVADLAEAQKLMQPLLGPFAAALFAAGLLASAQNAAVTGTLAGQIVMEGFTDLRMAPWKRRLVTRGLALVPTLVVLGALGERAAPRLLILSQVMLGLQLPFALVPLVRFTSDRRLMGALANARATAVAAWAVCGLVIAADGLVLARMLPI